MFLKRLNVSIYKKIVLIFLTVLFPLYIVSAYINILGTSFIKNEISKLMISNVGFYKETLANEINHIRTQLFQFLDGQDLQTLRVSSKAMMNFERVQVINRVYSRLQVIMNSSSYIANVCVYIDSLNQTISVKNRVSNIPNGEFEIIQKYLSKQTDTPIFYLDGKLLMMIQYPKIEYKSTKGLDCAVFVELSEEKIKEVLSTLINYNNSGTFLVDKDYNWVITPEKNEEVISGINDYLQRGVNTSENYIENVSINKERYLLIGNSLSLLNMKLFIYTPEVQLFGPLKIYNIWFEVLLAVSVIIIFIFSFSIRYMIHKPLRELIDAFKILEANNLDIAIYHDINDEFGYLYRSFNSMVARLKLTIRQVYEQKILAQQSELKQLQSQINPHFLYNSFFHLYGMINKGDYHNVSTFAHKLGSYYQHITRNGTDEIPLHMEVAHARNYVDIQTVRFSNRIDVHFDEVPEECKNFMVPRLILQPVIENAYEHGIESIEKGGIINVEMLYENGTICISVEDNGRGMSDEDLVRLQNQLIDKKGPMEKTGIFNVHRRINLKYGKQSGFYISRSKYGGIKTDIIIVFGGGG